MQMYDIILKKRQGREISREEIDFFIGGYTAGSIPEYQAAALLMAVFLNGLGFRETAELTTAMAGSGEQVDLSSIPGCKVDKHSTGGVGDKTTLVLVPLVAAAGVPVAKLSGRGLGHTGGTIDKLESIPGFRTDMEIPAFIRQVKDIGVAVAAQSKALVPADKKLYALRNATATVESIPLIASSIMSKKIAAGAGAVVLDVKAGNGAFLPYREDAFALARLMVAIGRQLGRATVALVTGMDQPLGYAVGNALEVREAILTLQGKGPPDLEKLCLALGAQMLILAGKAAGVEEAEDRLSFLLKNGNVLEKFKEMILAQGGNPEVVDNPALLPLAARQEQVFSRETGYVRAVDTKNIGRAAMFLGAGRQALDNDIDHSVGVMLHKKTGERVTVGEPLFTLYINRIRYLKEARRLLQNAFLVGEEKPECPPLIHGFL